MLRRWESRAMGWKRKYELVMSRRDEITSQEVARETEIYDATKEDEDEQIQTGFGGSEGLGGFRGLRG